MSQEIRSRLAVTAVLLAGLLGSAMSEETAPAKEEAAAKPADLPAAADLISRWIEASGGREAREAVKAMTMKGLMKIPMASVEAPLEVRAAAPDFFLVEITIPGMGVTRQGSAGGVAWSIDPAQGPSLKEGEELEDSRKESDFYGDLNYEKYYKTMETVELADFGGKPAYKVRLIGKANGKESFEIFDKESGQKVGSITESASPVGVLKVTTTFSDFEKFGDLVMPKSTTMDLGVMKQEIEVTEVSFDEIPAEVFDLPEEIKALSEGDEEVLQDESGDDEGDMDDEGDDDMDDEEGDDEGDDEGDEEGGDGEGDDK